MDGGETGREDVRSCLPITSHTRDVTLTLDKVRVRETTNLARAAGRAATLDTHDSYILFIHTINTHY